MFVNEIIIYNNKKVINILNSLMIEYEDVFINIKNIINIFEYQWMSISFKSDIKAKSSKVYSFNHKNKEIIDVIFNKL